LFIGDEWQMDGFVGFAAPHGWVCVGKFYYKYRAYFGVLEI
jgi:hypothetical protein